MPGGRRAQVAADKVGILMWDNVSLVKKYLDVGTGCELQKPQ